MRTRNAKKLADMTETMIDTVYVGVTDDGCFLDFGEGKSAVHIELPWQRVLDTVAAMVVAAGPAAGRNGISPDAYMEQLYAAIIAKMNEGIAAERQARKAGTS